MALTHAEALALVNRLIQETIDDIVPDRPDRSVRNDEMAAVGEAAHQRLDAAGLSVEDTRAVLAALVEQHIAEGVESPGDTIAYFSRPMEKEGES